jgi:nucleoside-diphosphate-sugar epimerase
VAGFDRPGAPHPPPECDAIDVDLSSDESVRAGFEAVRQKYGRTLASVIHLAAYYDFSGKPSPKYEEITVRGTERVLRELQNFEVQQLVFSSTMLVHAPCQPGERISEKSPLAPKWDYPESKIKTERLISAQRGGIPTIILRIAGVYDDHCRSIPIARQMQRIYERQFVGHLFPGDTSHGQSFVHVDDLVDALERVIERRKQLPAGTTLLIGEPEAVPYEELQQEFSDLLHHEPWTTRHIPKPLAKAGAWLQDHLPAQQEAFIKPWMIDLADEHYALDISRARELLGWEPKRSLRTSLPAMAKALHADPATWYKENKLEMPQRIAHELEHATEAA